MTRYVRCDDGSVEVQTECGCGMMQMVKFKTFADFAAFVSGRMVGYSILASQLEDELEFIGVVLSQEKKGIAVSQLSPPVQEFIEGLNI